MKLTFFIDFAYLVHEREESFIWALEKIKEFFTSDRLLQNVLITLVWTRIDESGRSVFPKSYHLFCMFHITKKITICKEYVYSHRNEHVMYMWNNIIYLNIEISFVVQLKHFEVVCADIPKFVQYVHETCLNPCKERFLTARTNRVTHTGNTTTKRHIDVNMNIVTLLTIK